MPSVEAINSLCTLKKHVKSKGKSINFHKCFRKPESGCFIAFTPRGILFHFLLRHYEQLTKFSIRKNSFSATMVPFSAGMFFSFRKNRAGVHCSICGGVRWSCLLPELSFLFFLKILFLSFQSPPAAAFTVLSPEFQFGKSCFFNLELTRLSLNIFEQTSLLDLQLTRLSLNIFELTLLLDLQLTRLSVTFLS